MSDTLNKLEQLVERDRDHDCEGFGAQRVCVRVVAVAELPTRFGEFHVVSFWNNRDEKEHLAIVHGDIVGAHDVDTRLHSECLTGDALGSLRCDCRDQLTQALTRIASLERGLLLGRPFGGRAGLAVQHPGDQQVVRHRKRRRNRHRYGRGHGRSH